MLLAHRKYKVLVRLVSVGTRENLCPGAAGGSASQAAAIELPELPCLLVDTRL